VPRGRPTGLALDLIAFHRSLRGRSDSKCEETLATRSIEQQRALDRPRGLTFPSHPRWFAESGRYLSASHHEIWFDEPRTPCDPSHGCVDIRMYDYDGMALSVSRTEPPRPVDVWTHQSLTSVFFCELACVHSFHSSGSVLSSLPLVQRKSALLFR
jgi:hypothetical protein